MPFGLTNAPSTFQVFIQDTLRAYLNIFCVVYLDDILIFLHSQDKHEAHIKLILDRLQGARLFANPEKCKFNCSKVEYLGYLIGRDGIKMVPSKLNTIRNWPKPWNVKDIQSFLGFANFYRRFIDHYSTIAHLLTELTKKDVPFVFSDAACAAFNGLKNTLTSKPVLQHYGPSRPCTVTTDTSDFGVAAVMQQPNDTGELQPVAFFLRKLTPAEINYKVYNKELLAVVEAFRNMRAWVLGTAQPVSVISNHKNLEYFMTSCVLNC
jgi:hypothetical protein